jgi:hypothetical protein
VPKALPVKPGKLKAHVDVHSSSKPTKVLVYLVDPADGVSRASERVTPTLARQKRSGKSTWIITFPATLTAGQGVHPQLSYRIGTVCGGTLYAFGFNLHAASR